MATLGKAIKISIGIIVVLLIVSPYFAGKMVENDYNGLIAKLKTQAGNTVKIDGKFERGIFSSTATTTIVDSSSNTVLVHAIKHGPLIFANEDGKFRLYPKIGKIAQVNSSLSAQQEKMVATAYGNKQAYRVVTFVSFNGDTETVFTNFPFNMSMSEGTVNWQGFNGNLTLNKDLTKYNFSIIFPLFDLTENSAVKIETSFKNIKIEAYKSDKDVNDKISISLESANFTSPGEHLDLTSFIVSGSHKTVQKMIDAEISMNFDKLVLTDQEYGPLVFDVNLKNFDASTFNVILTTLAGSSNQTEKMILNQKLQFKIHTSFVTPQGKVLFDSEGECGGPGVDAGNLNQLKESTISTGNFQIGEKLLVQVMVLFAEAQINRQERLYYMQHETSQTLNPYTMTDQQKNAIVSIWTRKTLDYLVAQKYLILQDGVYSSKIDVNKGMFTVNGSAKTDADMQKLQELKVIVPVERTVVPVAPITPVTPAVPVTTPMATTPSVSAPAVPANPTTEPPLGKEQKK